MKGILKRGTALVMTLVFMLSVGSTAYAEETATGAKVEGVELRSDGTVSWSITGTPENREVECYRLRVERMSNGNWNTYRSVNVYEDSYTINFGSTGVYRAQVRARFYGGAETAWSEYSNEVTVTRDDVGGWFDGLDPGEDIIANNNRYGNYGPGYVMNGPGSTSYGPGAGPGASTGTGTAGTSGWMEDSQGWWYRFSNGTYPSNGWHYLNGHWYYFDASGYRVTGWIWYNNSWYYSIPEGYMATGWNYISGKWYYMDQSGVMQTGYVTVDGLTYYLGADGSRLENGYTPEGHFFDNRGVMII